MALLNYDDAFGQLVGAGLLIDGGLVLGTARPVRCRVDGLGRERKGWYRLFEMPLDSGDSLVVGSYGVWQGASNNAQKLDLPKLQRSRMSAEQSQALAARIKADRAAAEAELKQQHERAAARAGSAWMKCPREGGVNAYLQRKGLPPGRLYGARLSPSGNLVIPMGDERGKVWGLQVIYSDPAVKARKGRDKDYWPVGLAKQGHWAMIGAASRGGVLLLCEGFATGASLHEATQYPVAVAFDAGNLLPVAQRLVKAYPGVRLLVCADDDWVQKCPECGFYTPVTEPTCRHCQATHGRSNPGATAAASAAMAVGGAWLAPEFPTQRPGDRKGDTDFNDLACAADGGLALVARQVDAALVAQGWAGRPAAREPSQPGGAGDGSRRQAVSVMQLDELVERFVPLDDGTGDHLFDRWAMRVCKVKQAVALLPAGVRWDDVKRHPLWISRGAFYLDQVGFDPGGDDDHVLLNTWQGWPMKPAVGSCERLLELLRYLCGEDNGDEVYWWLLRWMAYPLQHPGAKMSSAVIVHGPQGTGKSTVFQALAQIYGDYATVLNQRGLEDRFNSDWVDSKLFVLAEEVVTRAEMWHIKNELKELITGEWVRVNPKNVAAYRQRNHLNIVYISNEGQPLPLENDDRRHLVVWTPPAREEAYYDRVQAELHAGGVQALYHYLLALDLEDFHPAKRPPMTEAKRELIDVSLPSELRFINEWLAGDLRLPVCPALSTDAYARYLRWARDNGEMRPRPSNQFFNALTRLPGWGKRRDRVYDDAMKSIPAVVVYPPDALLEQHGNAQPAGGSATQWRTDCVNRFAKACRPAREEAWNE